MPRLNLTLDVDTEKWLSRYAKGAHRATLARTLLHEAIERREALARGRELAAAYAADRSDAREALKDLEPGALELWGGSGE